MKSQFQTVAEKQSPKVARARQRVNSPRYLGGHKERIADGRLRAALAAPCPVQAVIDVQAAHAVKEWDGGE